MPEETLRSQVVAEGRTRIAAERASAESHVIAAAITLLGAFVFLVALDQDPGGAVAGLAAGAIVSLVLSLALLLWHKVRYPLRRLRLDTEQVDLTYRFTDKILSFHKTFVSSSPQIARELEEGFRQIERGEEPTATAYREARSIIAAFLRNVDNETRNLRSQVMHKPLPEKHGRLLHVIDRVAASARYPLFGVGVALMLGAILARLL
ncbi:MAG: hypothetical protein U5R14_03285 [Gemmatimonadota bacterium]|nr:hypothetical protein [Gemmatimonadota bacterium]